MSLEQEKTFNLQDYTNYSYMWNHRGRDLADPAKTIEVKDALSTMDAPLFLPKVIENIVKEAAEPLLVGTQLLQRVEYKYGQVITFPAVGGAVAADIAEGQEYPEFTPSRGGATVTAKIGKSGLAVKFTEEMIKYSQFDLINMMLRMAGRALARHKEQKIFNLIAQEGVHVFNNLSPTSSVLGVTHGRSMNGEANGSCTMDDVFDAYAQVITQGFTPDTLLMHPLTWVMWIKDPVLRYFALSAGGGTFFATHRGNPAGQAPWGNSSQGGQGVSSGQNITPGGSASGLAASSLLDYPQNTNSAPVLPSYFGYPFTIIVSPMVPFNPRTKLTDIFMFDRSELGFLFVDEDVTTEDFVDPRTDILKLKVKERYAMAISNEGQGVAVLKNVKVVPNEIVLPAQTTIQSGISGSVLPIGQTDNVLD